MYLIRNELKIRIHKIFAKNELKCTKCSPLEVRKGYNKMYLNHLRRRNTLAVSKYGELKKIIKNK